MANGGTVFIDDGIIEWFDGPEWDEVALESFKDSAPELQSYAQDNAPWEDRTGMARESLTAEAGLEADGTAYITLAHGVDYGYWLEVIQNGQFAIIMPTLEAYGPRVMADAVSRIASARKGRD